MKGDSLETFKEIKDSPWHGINRKGQVKNLNTGRILKGHKEKNGKITVQLAPTYKDYYVHNLVAEAFIPKPRNREVYLIHRDGNNSNNNIENLEYVDKKEYQRDLYSQGKNHGHRGAQSKPIVINETGEKFESTAECAKHLGVDSSCVWQQLHGKIKTCKGFTFRYL